MWLQAKLKQKQVINSNNKYNKCYKIFKIINNNKDLNWYTYR